MMSLSFLFFFHIRGVVMTSLLSVVGYRVSCLLGPRLTGKRPSTVLFFLSCCSILCLQLRFYMLFFLMLGYYRHHYLFLSLSLFVASSLPV